MPDPYSRWIDFITGSWTRFVAHEEQRRQAQLDALRRELSSPQDSAELQVVVTALEREVEAVKAELTELRATLQRRIDTALGDAQKVLQDNECEAWRCKLEQAAALIPNLDAARPLAHFRQILESSEIPHGRRARLEQAFRTAHEALRGLATKLEEIHDKERAGRELNAKIEALEAELKVEHGVTNESLNSWRSVPQSLYPGLCSGLLRLLGDAELEQAWSVDTKSWRAMRRTLA